MTPLALRFRYASMPQDPSVCGQSMSPALMSNAEAGGDVEILLVDIAHFDVKVSGSATKARERIPQEQQAAYLAGAA